MLARVLSWQPLVALGKVSYGMYLFHLIIAWGVFHQLKPDVWPHITSRMSDPSLLGSALLLSEATVIRLHFQLIERKFMALRRPGFVSCSGPDREI
jgi:peptidoglycan/LPS O-acetylase OafA/YrhL